VLAKRKNTSGTIYYLLNLYFTFKLKRKKYSKALIKRKFNLFVKLIISEACFAIFTKILWSVYIIVVYLNDSIICRILYIT